MGYLLVQRSHSPVCIIPRLSAVAREQVELEAVEVSGPEDARVEAGLLHERDDGLADVDRVERVVVRLPRLQIAEGIDEVQVIRRESCSLCQWVPFDQSFSPSCHK